MKLNDVNNWVITELVDLIKTSKDISLIERAVKILEFGQMKLNVLVTKNG